jgi:DNA repair ATPase RecN
MLSAPGNYSATLTKEVGGEITTLSGPVHFEVVPLREGALQGSSPAEAAAFWRSYEETVRNSSAVSQTLDTELDRVEAMRTALSRSSAAPGELDERLAQLRKTLQKLQDDLTGNRAKNQVGEKQSPNVGSRLNAVELGIYGSTYGPTATHQMTLGLANKQLQQVTSELVKARSDAATLGDDLLSAGAPWVEGNPLPR